MMNLSFLFFRMGLKQFSQPLSGGGGGGGSYGGDSYNNGFGGGDGMQWFLGSLQVKCFDC